jgi:hypothetical protein
VVIILNEVWSFWYEKIQVGLNYFQVNIHAQAGQMIIGRLFAVFIVEVPRSTLRETSHDLHLTFLRKDKN